MSSEKISSNNNSLSALNYAKLSRKNLTNEWQATKNTRSNPIDNDNSKNILLSQAMSGSVSGGYSSPSIGGVVGMHSMDFFKESWRYLTGAKKRQATISPCIAKTKIIHSIQTDRRTKETFSEVTVLGAGATQTTASVKISGFSPAMQSSNSTIKTGSYSKTIASLLQKSAFLQSPQSIPSTTIADGECVILGKPHKALDTMHEETWIIDGVELPSMPKF